MIGLIVLLFFALYFAISLWVIFAVLKWAARNQRSGWWGVLAAFVVYNLVFWDWLPTMSAHKYYCATEAGFWVYKTPEQWVAENPGVMEELVANKGAPSKRTGNMENYTNTYLLNPRFNWVVKKQPLFMDGIQRREQEVIDNKNQEVLARYVDFSTGFGNMMTASDWRAMKFWLRNEHCSGGGFNQDAIRNFRDNFLGENK